MDRNANSNVTGRARGFALGLLVLCAVWAAACGGEDTEETPEVLVATPGPSPRPFRTPVALEDAAPTPLTAAATYEVVEGDNPWLIAEKLAVPTPDRDAWIQAFLFLNGVEATGLQIGDTVFLPPFGNLVTESPAATAVPDQAQTNTASDASGAAEGATTGTGGEDAEAPEPGAFDQVADDDEDEEEPGGSPPGVSLHVNSVNVGACSTIDDLTYCYGSGGAWTCNAAGSSIRCSGPSGQTTTCTGNGSAMNCSGPLEDATTCTNDGLSITCNAGGIDSQVETCAEVGTATICLGGSNGD
jgi:hypothetical protein